MYRRDRFLLSNGNGNFDSSWRNFYEILDDQIRPGNFISLLRAGDYLQSDHIVNKCKVYFHQGQNAFKIKSPDFDFRLLILLVGNETFLTNNERGRKIFRHWISLSPNELVSTRLLGAYFARA